MYKYRQIKKDFFSKKQIDRFFKNLEVKNDDECWEWLDRSNRGGYGVFKIYDQTYLAHRVSYVLHKNDLLGDLNELVIHSCDNRKCCNPNHLRVGTHKDNADDMMSRNRHKPNFKVIPENYIEYLGKEYDSTIGNKFGISESAVGAQRRKLKIEKRFTKELSEIIPLLGKKTDVELSKQFGIDIMSITLRRNKLGIKPVGRHPNGQRNKELLLSSVHLIGTMPDRAIANKIGCSYNLVRNTRISLKLPKYSENNYNDIEKICPVCGAVFIQKARGHLKKYCSVGCKYKYNKNEVNNGNNNSTS